MEYVRQNEFLYIKKSTVELAGVGLSKAHPNEQQLA